MAIVELCKREQIRHLGLIGWYLELKMNRSLCLAFCRGHKKEK